MADGYARLALDRERRPKDAFLDEERLREETGSRAVVVVRIVDLVRVELELVVVEVEDRGVRELVLVTRNLPSSVWGTGARESLSLLNSFLNIIRRHPMVRLG